MWRIEYLYKEVAVKIGTEGQQRGSHAKIKRKYNAGKQKSGRKGLEERNELGVYEAEKEAPVAGGELAERRMAMDGVGEVTAAWSEAMWTRVRSVDFIQMLMEGLQQGDDTT